MLKQNQVPKTLNLKLPHLHDLLHIFDDMLGHLPKFRTKRVVVRSICEATAWSSRGSLKGSCNGSIMQVLQQGLESRGFRCGARGDYYAHVKRTEVCRKIRMLDLRYEFLVVPVGSSKLRAHEISGVSRRYGDAFFVVQGFEIRESSGYPLGLLQSMLRASKASSVVVGPW